MSYSYTAERAKLFTENGQRLFLSIRDKTQRLLKDAGAVRLQEVVAGTSGDAWTILAAMDRLVELGELREITNGNVQGQHRVFVSIRQQP